MKYRFKTKKEFIKEFGSSWRKKIPYSFTTSMDYLLGTKFNSTWDIPWSISSEMYKLNTCLLNPNVKVL